MAAWIVASRLLSIRLNFALALLCALLFVPAPDAHASATVTTLSVTSNGMVVTTVKGGSVVTLTATVEMGARPANPGLVSFCDASAAYCTDIHQLGNAQLTSAGKATFRFVPAVGSHTYKAIFRGTKKAATSASALSTLTVTGEAKSVVSVSQSGIPGKFTFNAIVGGNSSIAPSGPATFQDNDTNTFLARGELAGETGLRFPQAWDLPAQTQNFAANMVSADFNQDGIPDLLVVSNSGQAVIYLGQGDGTFLPCPKGPIGLAGLSGVAVADFNSDGIPDFAVTGYTSTGVYLGNGDCSFTPVVLSPQVSGLDGDNLAVADFNNDGIPDLAMLSPSVILLGNGDGTFTPGPSLNVGGGAVAVGDFNGDGLADLAVTSGSQLSILLSLGNGSFTTAPSPNVAANAESLDVADFNGDGKADLASISFNGSVSILLGNGDGTFTPAAQSPSVTRGVSAPGSSAVGDFNGDGIPDLVTAAYADVTPASVLIGNGDGTFTPAPVNPAATIFAVTAATADFNGDGVSDIAIGSGSTQTATVASFLSLAQSAPVTVTGELPGFQPPSHVQAIYAGDSNYAPATSPSFILKSTPLVTFVPSLNPAPYGVSLSFNAVVSGDGPVPTGIVSSTYGQNSLDSAGTTSFRIEDLPVGQYSINGTYSGDANYNPFTTPSVDLVIQKAPQTINFPAPASPVRDGSAPIALEAIATSGLPITYRVTGPASISGATLTILGAGAIAITAYQDGNSTYNPAKPVEQTVVVSPASH